MLFLTSDQESADIEAEGVVAFLQDLSLSPADVVTLVIAWLLDAQEMGVFTKEEFVQGFEKLKSFLSRMFLPTYIN